MKKIFIIAVVFMLSGCTQEGPWPILFGNHVEGSPEFQAGWHDGCESGFATYGTAIYKMWYSFKQEYSMMDNKDYDMAWHEAFDTCRHYLYKWNTQTTYMDPL